MVDQYMTIAIQLLHASIRQIVRLVTGRMGSLFETRIAFFVGFWLVCSRSFVFTVCFVLHVVLLMFVDAKVSNNVATTVATSTNAATPTLLSLPWLQPSRPTTCIQV